MTFAAIWKHEFNQKTAVATIWASFGSFGLLFILMWPYLAIFESFETLMLKQFGQLLIPTSGHFAFNIPL